MGKAVGPAPTPTALKKLKGERKDRINHDEPQPDIGKPDRPQLLSTEAKREWNRIAGELARIGVLALVDRATLAAYCEAWAEWARLTKETQQIVANGEQYITGANGVFYAHPTFKLRDQANSYFLKCAAELGLTPSARSRIKVDPSNKKQQENALFDFLQQRSSSKN